MTKLGIIHTVEDQRVDTPKSWNNYTGVMSNKAKRTINSFILCLRSRDSGCFPVLTHLTSHNPPRALQRLHWSLQKSIGFS